jgi:proteasome lid subunit RPN8/RPN11
MVDIKTSMLTINTRQTNPQAEMPEAPKIVKEIRKTVEARPPPEAIQLDGIDLAEWDLTDDWVELYISHACFQKMVNHCDAFKEDAMEVMGLLLGDVFQWRNRIYTVAEDTVAAEIEDSTATSVRFGNQGLEEVARALDEMEYEYLIVGWYHSHPGFTTFLSDKDLETHKKNFSKPFHATIVIDPVNRQFRSYKVIDNQYIEKRFQLYEESSLERELTAKRRGEIMAYVDALVQKQIGPGQRAGPLSVPNPKSADTSNRLPMEVRQAIQTDIQRMIDEQDRRREQRKQAP